MDEPKAKRAAAKLVQPISHNGVRYEASGTNSVRAVDESGARVLWDKPIYSIKYDLGKETDVQDVNITNLEVEGEALKVVNEAGATFWVDLQTGEPS